MAKDKKKKGGEGFNAEDHDTSGFSTIPAGTYRVALVKFERTEAKNKGNFYQKCQFAVAKGEHKKYPIFEMFNLENDNEQAVEIAERKYAQMLMAAGVPRLKSKWDLTPLLGKQIEVKVAVDEGTAQYGPKNIIREFVINENKGRDDEDDDDDSGDDGEKKKDKKVKDKKKKGKDKKKKDKKGGDPWED